MNVETMHIVRIPSWSEFEWLRHGFSTRAGGSSTVYSESVAGLEPAGELNLGFTQDDDPGIVAANRASFLRAVGGEDAAEMVTLRQVHGTAVKPVAAGEVGLRTL